MLWPHVFLARAPSSQVDPQVFEREFGAPMEQLSELIASKTVNISQLMLHVPAGTPDPTPYLYNTALYAAAGLLCVSAAANALMRPVDKKHFTKDH